MKFRIHIKSESDEATRNELREITEIVVSMRAAQKKWKENFGYTNKINMEKFEKKADSWVDKHKVFYRGFKADENPV